MISRRYAKALLELAVREGIEDAIKKDILMIGKLARQKKYFDFFTDRMLSVSDKMEALAGLHRLTKDFLRLVIKNKREELLYLISREYVGLLNKRGNIADVDAVSRVPLSAVQQADIVQNLGKYLKKKINLNCKTDRKLIGGICLQYEGKVMNGTVSGMLSGILSELVRE